MTRLAVLGFLSNPLTTLVLSEPLAISMKLSVNFTTIASLRNQGISVFAYPLAVQLISPHRTGTGAFEFTITGPPGSYTVLTSANLVAWGELASVTNQLGSIVFTDGGANLSPRKFYRARSAP
jgi:hypothetical protein